jgi:hypothetical protein
MFFFLCLSRNIYKIKLVVVDCFHPLSFIHSFFPLDLYRNSTEEVRCCGFRKNIMIASMPLNNSKYFNKGPSRIEQAVKPLFVSSGNLNTQRYYTKLCLDVSSSITRFISLETGNK